MLAHTAFQATISSQGISGMYLVSPAREIRKIQIEMKQDNKSRLGPEAPGWKHIIIVIIAVGVLIGLSWIAWFKFGWFH